MGRRTRTFLVRYIYSFIGWINMRVEFSSSDVLHSHFEDNFSFLAGFSTISVVSTLFWMR
jgi:hypothetical protein